MATITASRKDNGLVDFTYTNSTTTFTASGYWDDATPWASNTFDLQFWYKGGDTSKQSFRVPDGAIPGRTAILIHHGTSVNWSEGCLIVGQAFIDQIYDDLDSKNQLPTIKGATPSPVKLIVNGDYGAKLKLSATASSVTEGENIQLKVDLTGAGGANGLSKDLYVKIAAVGGAAQEGSDFKVLSGLPGLVKLPGGGTEATWLKISKGTPSATLNIPTLTDNNDKEVSEGVTFEIVDYRAVNVVKKGPYNYKDEGANTLLTGADKSEAIAIKDKPSLINKTIDASGGVEGYDNTEQFAPGQNIGVTFDPYSIPDRMIVTNVSDGSVIFDTGFIGDFVYTTPFTVPASSDGRVRIQVLTNDPGTAWTFQMSSQAAAMMAANGTLQSTVFTLAQSMTAAAAASTSSPIEVVTSNSVVSEGANEGVGFAFSIKLNDVSLAGKVLEWRVVPTGTTPASTADFIGNAAGLKGQFTVSKNAKAGDFILPVELPDAKADGLSEGQETFRIQIYDAKTGKAILTSNGTSVGTTFSIVDDFNEIAPISGSPDDDNLVGTKAADVILGGLGNDTLSGRHGDDVLDGDVGDDIFSGGSGNDIIVPWFGNDIIDGNTGIDTVYIPRLFADCVVTRLRDGTYLITDQSGVPLGEKSLKFIETVVFSDRVVDLILTGDSGKNTLAGTNNASTIYGRAGSDILEGNGGNDKLYGEAQNDTLRGGAGRDTLSGGDGNDYLDGGAGKDILVGGRGKDTSVGGAGADRFDYNSLSEMGSRIPTRDVIRDFSTSIGDVIDLSTIDASTRASGNNKFIFIGTQGFHNKAGEVRYGQSNAAGTANDKTIVSGDVNGDGVSDFQIELTGLKTLTAGDFVL